MKLLPQPYVLPFDELPGAISKRALTEHYKLYTGYRETLKRVDAKLKTAGQPTKPLSESEYANLLRVQSQALAGAYLHELFFQNLTDSTVHIMILLGVHKLMEIGWGTQEAFRKAFRAAAMNAKGWAILGLAEDNKPRILTLDSHEMMPAGVTPLFVLDTYEHAYWMDHGADRAAYLDALAHYHNWFAADTRLKAI